MAEMQSSGIWYEKDVASAIEESKRRNAVFIVFIRDAEGIIADSFEKNIWNTSAVKEKILQSNAVAICINSGTETCRQFVQFYPLTSVPATYFIATNGVALDVITEASLTLEAFLDRYEAVLQKHVKSSIPSTANGANITSQSPNEDYVSQRLAEVRKNKEKEELAKSRAQELERIRQSRELTKGKAESQRRQAQEAIEERRREKQEDAAAKQRILEQIARDKAERSERFKAKEREEAKNTDKLPINSSSSKSTIETDLSNTRIQFKFADGSSCTETFSSSQPMLILFEYLSAQRSIHTCSLATVYPRRVFPNTETRTLEELQLAPASVLVVLPGKNKSPTVSTSPSNKSLTTYILAPFVAVWALLVCFFNSVFGTRPAENSGVQSESSRRMTSPRDNVRQRRFQTKGNIMKLGDRPDDDDDENNTWNGNSTQQM